MSTRLDELASYAVMDTPPEAAFADLVALARELSGCAFAGLSFVDDHRQWVKAGIGLPAEVPLERSLCARIVHTGSNLVRADLNLDAELAPIANGWKRYAGVPLKTSAGHILGTLCVADAAAGEFSAPVVNALEGLAKQAMHLLEMRRQGVRAAAALLEQNRVGVLGGSASAIAHEVKNPLAVAVLTVQLLRDSPSLDPAKRDQMVQKVDTSLERIGKTISSMQRLARRRDSGVTETVKVADLANDILEIARLRAKDAGLELRTELAALEIECRPALIAQVLWPLLTNALEAAAGSEAAWIELRCAEIGGHVVWSVRDSGPGLSGEARARWMEPYFTTKKNQAGLGLAQARELCARMGAQLELADEEGATEFRVRLASRTAPREGAA